jgi:ubiquinone/menaquinone biosynthesis C-methylase UbiE
MSDYRTIYATRAEDYDRLIAREDVGGSVLSTICSLAPIRGRDLVDVGAGTGRLALGLGARGARSVHALDAARAMLDVLERRAVEKGVCRLTTTVADHESLPLPSACCDVATEGWSFGHATRFFPDDWQAHVARSVAELLRIVRPGGTAICIETLGLDGLPPRDALLAMYAWLEGEQGFRRVELDTDFVFQSEAEAQRLAPFFFGEAWAERMKGRARLPEKTGLWWRRVR